MHTLLRFAPIVSLAVVACGGGANVSNGGTGGATSSSAAGNTAAQSSNGSGTTNGSTNGSTSTGAGGSVTPGPLDLCMGLVKDKADHPMTALAKPALNQTVVDAEFGTTIRRITAVTPPAGGGDAAIVPLYSTVSAWNADESLLMLLQVDKGQALYDGKTYAFIKNLDINPPDVEQVYWDTSDPDLLYYVDNDVGGGTFTRYHVSTGKKDAVHDFKDVCNGSAVTGGDDPMFTSWNSHRVGLACGTKMFIYDQSTDEVLGSVSVPANSTPPADVAPSGTLAYLESGTGQVLDEKQTVLRSLGLQAPDNHASLGRLANGHDTWNGAVYDDGNDDASSNVGILVTWDMTNAMGGAVIGPKTGYPYPPDGHVSALAYKQPGWVFVSTIQDHANPLGQKLLDDENLVADTNTGAVCRIGRHRSWGKDNTHLQTPYWAEPHTTPSPSGTRAVFASDWGNGTTVDTYVVELPSYKP